MRAALVLTLMTGCLWTPSRPAERTADAPASDTSSDGHLGPPAFCPNPGAWGTPRVLDELQVAEDEGDPYLSPDGLDLYFNTPDSFYVAHRATRSDPFPAATALPMQPTFSSARGAFLSDDQQRIWFHECCEYPGPDFTDDLFFAHRLSTLQFEAGTHLMMDMPAMEEFDPSLTSNELTLALALHDSGQDRLYLSTRATTNDEFPRPTTPIELGSSGLDATGPWISGDGNVLYWGANATIYWATRASTASPWITQGEVVLADGRAQHGDPALTRDGAILVYAASGSQYQLFMAERSCL